VKQKRNFPRRFDTTSGKRGQILSVALQNRPGCVFFDGAGRGGSNRVAFKKTGVQAKRLNP